VTIDFEAGTLEVRQSLVPVDGKMIFEQPKTALSKRRLSIPPAAVSELRRHKARQAELRLFYGTGYENHDLVFPAPNGKPQDPRAFTRRYERLLQRAGLPSVIYHALRHTFACLLLERGMSIKTIQEALGHATPAFDAGLHSGDIFSRHRRHAAGRGRQDGRGSDGGITGRLNQPLATHWLHNGYTKTPPGLLEGFSIELYAGVFLVGGTGIEPVTSCMSSRPGAN